MKPMLIAIALIFTACRASHAEILYNAQEQPVFMSGLEIAGVQYNVSFLYGCVVRLHLRRLHGTFADTDFLGR